MTVPADEAGGLAVVFKSRLRFAACLAPLGVGLRAHVRAMSDLPASRAGRGGFSVKADRDGFVPVENVTRHFASLKSQDRHICLSEFAYVEDLGFGRTYDP